MNKYFSFKKVFLGVAIVSCATLVYASFPLRCNIKGSPPTEKDRPRDRVIPGYCKELLDSKTASLTPDEQVDFYIKTLNNQQLYNYNIWFKKEQDRPNTILNCDVRGHFSNWYDMNGYDFSRFTPQKNRDNGALIVKYDFFTLILAIPDYYKGNEMILNPKPKILIKPPCYQSDPFLDYHYGICRPLNQPSCEDISHEEMSKKSSSFFKSHNFDTE
jgi:hypothetical protein